MRPHLTRHFSTTLAVVIAVMIGATACGTQSAAPNPTPSQPSATAAEPDDSALVAAEETVRAFFAVKARAKDVYGVKIDEQSPYLTERAVHPSVAYEEDMGDAPTGIEDAEVSVDLSNSRWRGDEIQIDFEAETIGVSYPLVGGKIKWGEGTEQSSGWDGTATLEERDGTWLINHLTIDSFGGAVS